MTPMPMRPRALGELFDAAVKLYRENARTLIGASLAIVIPLQLIAGLVMLSIYTDGRDIGTGFSGFGHTFTVAQAHSRLGASGIQAFTGFIVGGFTLAACVRALSDAYVGQPVSIGESLRFGLRRLLPLLMLEIFVTCGEIVGFALLIIPGIWLYCSWSLGVPALMMEGLGPLRALQRSGALIKARWWSTAIVILTGQLLVFVIGDLCIGVITAAALANSHPSVLFAVGVSVVGAIVAGVVLQPFWAAVITVLYYDLRIRAGDYDNEVSESQLPPF